MVTHKEATAISMLLENVLAIVDSVHNRLLEDKSESAAEIVCLMKVVWIITNLALSKIKDMESKTW